MIHKNWQSIFFGAAKASGALLGRQTTAALRQLRKLPPQFYATLFGCLVILIGVSYGMQLLWPRDLAFSFAQKNCYPNPTILPNFMTHQSSRTYETVHEDIFSLGSYPLYAGTTCVIPDRAPQPGSTETLRLTLLGLGWLHKTITITTPEVPTVLASATLAEPISPADPLTFTLSDDDVLFKYQLVVNDQKVSCPTKENILICDISSLGLAQSTPYTVALQRTFKGTAETALEQTITTIDALGVAAASIAPGTTTYGVPDKLVLTFNKPLQSFEGVELRQVGGSTIPTTASPDGNTLVVRFGQALPRNAQFTVSLQKAVATDRAYLPSAFTMQFATSGGPKAVAISIGSIKVGSGASIILTFDSPILPGQNLPHFVRVESGGNMVASTVTLQGQRVIITPAALPNCTPFTVRVVDGLQSDVGVTGGSDWQFHSRIICQTTFAIGTSRQGRQIIGYRFGSGPSRIILVGNIHGDEKSASSTLYAFMSDLEANAQNIPAHRSVIIIPVANPDGYAANIRLNANGVDLNRNFPANNWKAGVTMPDGSFHPEGGGPAPLSEPESSSLASYVVGQSPRLVVSYHSVARLVAANESGDSRTLADIYGSKSGFPSYGNEASGIFSYDTTGAFEDWLHDQYGIPALLVELATKTSNEFGTHKSALWTMIQLP